MNKIHITYLEFSDKFKEICSFIYAFIISELCSSSCSVQDYFWLDRYTAILKAVSERGVVLFAAPTELTYVPTAGASTRQETVQQWKMSEGLESQWCLLVCSQEGSLSWDVKDKGCIEHWSKGNQCLNPKRKQKVYMSQVYFQRVYSHKMSWSQPVRIGTYVF